MKKTHTTLIFAGLFLSLLQACNTISIEDYQSKIVVDGWIEQGKPAQVLLTKSTPYFGEIDSVILREYSLTHAKVTLNDGDVEEILTLKPNRDFFPPYIYVSTEIVGEIGKLYTLTVESDGLKTIATTTITKPVTLNKAYLKKNDDSDSLGVITIELVDPADEVNYYIVQTKILNKNSNYTRVFSPTFSDEYFSGENVHFDLQKGNDNPTASVNDLYFNVYDTISVKFCTIDHISYKFWMSFQKELINTANPFASANAMVESNITNGLGIWCGYGTMYYTVFPE